MRLASRRTAFSRINLLSNQLKNFSQSKLLQDLCKNSVEAIKAAGSFKKERVISSPQGMEIKVGTKTLLNFCANNYLNLSNNQSIIQASQAAMRHRGYGVSSVRFICGTQDLHKELEKKISDFHSKEDAILYVSCFDANGGVFEALLNEQDAVISDSLNHASIIDGIRLCKAKRLRYNHLDMTDLEEKLKAEQNSSRIKLIVTDGVFSMDGDIAPLDKIVNLAKKYGANIMIDDSHATGVIGKTGRGTPELFGLSEEIDIINSTMGKALGGSCGGYTTAKKEIIDLLRQKSRPYLFSNSILPSVAAGQIEVFKILEKSNDFEKLNKSTRYFRQKMNEKGFKILGNTDCPIVPILIGDDRIATEFGIEMEEEGIYVVGFSYPVVPKGQARIRVQLSSGHTKEQIDKAISAFEVIARRKGVIH